MNHDLDQRISRALDEAVATTTTSDHALNSIFQRATSHRGDRNRRITITALTALTAGLAAVAVGAISGGSSDTVPAATPTTPTAALNADTAVPGSADPVDGNPAATDVPASTGISYDTATALITVMDPYWEQPRRQRLTIVGDDVEFVDDDVSFLGDEPVSCYVVSRVIDGQSLYRYEPGAGWGQPLALVPPGTTTQETGADGEATSGEVPRPLAYPNADTPGALLDQLQSASEFEPLGHEELNGVPVTRLEALSPSAIAIDQLRAGSAVDGYIAVQSLELWVAEDETILALHATLGGDPMKPLNGAPPWVHIEFRDLGAPHEPVVAPTVGEVDPEIDALLCTSGNVPDTTE